MASTTVDGNVSLSGTTMSRMFPWLISCPRALLGSCTFSVCPKFCGNGAEPALFGPFLGLDGEITAAVVESDPGDFINLEKSVIRELVGKGTH